VSTPYDDHRPDGPDEAAGPSAPRYDEPLDPPLEGEPRPVLDEPVETSTDSRVAAAVARLDALGDAPPAEHVEVYEDVHRVLQDALADAARGDQQR
jgi:hypothetical protein